MGAANDAVHIEPPTGTEQITGVRFSNFWFDNNCTYGLHIVGSSTATFGEVEIYGSRFLSHLGASVFIEAGSNFEGLIAIGLGTWRGRFGKAEVVSWE